MPLDPRSFKNDDFPRWAEEPPTPADGSLVPGSQFHEEQWIMAAGMLARGSSFLYVARAMGCSRTTLWRAYYGSKDFRHRVWWERQALNREAYLRLSSLRILVVEQIERLVSGGDPSTIRWLADRLGLLSPPDSRPLRQAGRDRGADFTPDFTPDLTPDIGRDAARRTDAPADAPPSSCRNSTTTSPARYANAPPIRAPSPPSWPSRRRRDRRVSIPGPSTPTTPSPTLPADRRAGAVTAPSAAGGRPRDMEHRPRGVSRRSIAPIRPYRPPHLLNRQAIR